MPAASRPVYQANQLRPDNQSGWAIWHPPAVRSGRDLRLDALRGFLLVAMAVNHLDTELRVLTDYPFGFVSSAEGFVFLSGLVAGLVYTRRMTTLSPPELRQKAWHRAGQIYLAHLTSFAIALVGLNLVVLGKIPGTFAAPPAFCEHPVRSLLLGASLLYQPGLLDILPMYCGFMLALPLMLGALRKGHWGRLLALSGSLWLLSQLGLRDQAARWLQTFLPVNLGAFDILAWQLLFVLGTIFGYYWATASKPLLSFRPAMLALCLFVAVPLWFCIKYHDLPAGLSMNMVWSWADKTHIAPLRLVNFVVLAYLIAAVAVHRPRFLTIRPLAFLGRNSLVVFTAQATICFFVLTQPGLFATFASRTMTAVAMVTLLFPAAWLNERIARRRLHRNFLPTRKSADLAPPSREVA